MRSLRLVVLGCVAWAGCGDDEGSTDAGVADAAAVDASGDAAGALCAERTGGALIQLQIVEETLTVWMTDTDFIDEAADHFANGTIRVPNFAQVVAGTDCDAQYTWHVDPSDAAWADLTAEVCDGAPSYLEANRDEWIAQVGNYCPWATSAVLAFDDRR